jgi:hypothetical protein
MEVRSTLSPSLSIVKVTLQNLYYFLKQVKEA